MGGGCWEQCGIRAAGHGQVGKPREQSSHSRRDLICRLIAIFSQETLCITAGAVLAACDSDATGPGGDLALGTFRVTVPGEFSGSWEGQALYAVGPTWEGQWMEINFEAGEAQVQPSGQGGLRGTVEATGTGWFVPRPPAGREPTLSVDAVVELNAPRWTLPD